MTVPATSSDTDGVRGGSLSKDDLLQRVLKNEAPYRNRLLLAAIYSQERNFDMAEALLVGAQTIRPNDAAAPRALGAIFECQGRTAGARAQYHRAIQLDPTSPAWVYFGAGKSALNPYISDDLRICYVPIPKCASTSIKASILASVKNIDDISNPHKFFDNPFTKTAEFDQARVKEFFCFAIIRDPVLRFLSYFSKNIVEERSLFKEKSGASRGSPLSPEPSLGEFLDHLPEYMFDFRSVRHHVLPQAAYLRGYHQYFHLYRFEQIEKLFDKLEVWTERDFPRKSLMKSEKKAGDILKVLTKDQLRRLVEFYKDDYELLGDFYSVEELGQEADLA